MTSSENVNNLNNWPFSPKTNTFASLLLSLFLASDRLGKNLLAGISLGLKEIMGLKLNSRLDWSWEMGRGQFWAKFRTTECLWCFNAQVPVAYNDAGGGKGGKTKWVVMMRELCFPGVALQILWMGVKVFNEKWIIIINLVNSQPGPDLRGLTAPHTQLLKVADQRLTTRDICWRLPFLPISLLNSFIVFISIRNHNLNMIENVILLEAVHKLCHHLMWRELRG